MEKPKKLLPYHVENGYLRSLGGCDLQPGSVVRSQRIAGVLRSASAWNGTTQEPAYQQARTLAALESGNELSGNAEKTG